MTPSVPMVKRSLRTIQAELEFLAETSVITPEQLAAILGNLPDSNNVSAQSLRNGTTSQQTVSPPTQSFNNLNVNDASGKGFYAPNPSPSPTPRVETESQNQLPPAYPQAPVPPTAPLKYATATYAYKPSDAYDLELAPGERIAILEEMNADWWKGRSERTGREGIFPRSYVKEDFQPSFNNGKDASYGNMPVEVANGSVNGPQPPNKGQEMGKKFGKKLGNAAIFGAGATIGSNIVNSIF